MTKNKKGHPCGWPFMSGYQDSNLGPPVPKTGGIYYSPLFIICHKYLNQRYTIVYTILEFTTTHYHCLQFTIHVCKLFANRYILAL